MKGFLILFALILLSSCSSFERMKYRQLKKVPATHQEFSVSDREKNKTASIQSTAVNDSVSVTVELPEATQIAIISETPTATSYQAPAVKDSLQAREGTVQQDKEISQAPPLKTDFSLVIAVLIILLGIFLVTLAIFGIPYFNLSLALRIGLAALCLFWGGTMISRGTMMFIIRFRNRKTYKES